MENVHNFVLHVFQWLHVCFLVFVKTRVTTAQPSSGFVYQRFGIEVVTLKRFFGPCSVHCDEHLRGSYTALCNALGPYTKPIDRGIICYFPSTALLMESAARETAIPFIFIYKWKTCIIVEV